jgi:predicted permease
MPDIKVRAVSRWDSNFRIGAIAVVWLMTAGMLVVAGAADASGENELLFVVVAAPFAVTMVLIGAAVGAWRHLVIACAALALFLAVLPKIRWGPSRPFTWPAAKSSRACPSRG